MGKGIVSENRNNRNRRGLERKMKTREEALAEILARREESYVLEPRKKACRRPHPPSDNSDTTRILSHQLALHRSVQHM